MQNKEKKERADQTEELEKIITTLERTLEDKISKDNYVNNS